VTDCLVVNNTGASSDGVITAASTSFVLLNNTIYGSGRNGLTANTTSAIRAFLIRNNLLVNNVNDGCRMITIGSGNANAADPVWDGNAYYNNGTNRSGMDDQGVSAPINLVATYTNVSDQVLTASPFVHVSAVAADLAVDASNNLKVTSGSYNFAASDVGSTIMITFASGSSWTMGQYTITSVSSGAAFLSSSPAATSTTGGNWYFNDFRLNVLAGGGSSCRGTGSPGSLPGISQVGGTDMGCLQHLDNSPGLIPGIVTPRPHAAHFQ
jgi:hypothetical protein